MDSATPKARRFCHNTPTWSCRPGFLPGTAWEPLGKDRADREETTLNPFTGQLSKMTTLVSVIKVASSLLYKQTLLIGLHLNPDAPEIYLGFTYRSVLVDSDHLIQANSFSYLRTKSPFPRYFSTFLNPVISNLFDKQSHYLSPPPHELILL